MGYKTKKEREEKEPGEEDKCGSDTWEAFGRYCTRQSATVAVHFDDDGERETRLHVCAHSFLLLLLLLRIAVAKTAAAHATQTVAIKTYSIHRCHLNHVSFSGDNDDDDDNHLLGRR